MKKGRTKLDTSDLLKKGHRAVLSVFWDFGQATLELRDELPLDSGSQSTLTAPATGLGSVFKKILHWQVTPSLFLQYQVGQLYSVAEASKMKRVVVKAWRSQNPALRRRMPARKANTRTRSTTYRGGALCRARWGPAVGGRRWLIVGVFLVLVGYSSCFTCDSG